MAACMVALFNIGQCLEDNLAVKLHLSALQVLRGEGGWLTSETLQSVPYSSGSVI